MMLPLTRHSRLTSTIKTLHHSLPLCTLQPLLHLLIDLRPIQDDSIFHHASLLICYFLGRLHPLGDVGECVQVVGLVTVIGGEVLEVEMLLLGVNEK